MALFDWLKPGLPVTHDGQDHVARVANFYQSLSEGNLVPRWAGNLNWGYGHPILMFLYPLPSYLASLFHFLGFSLVAGTKIVFGLSLILSGLFMYLWTERIWGKKAGFVGGLLYTLAPYRLVDLYVRGAIGECWAFVWPPLICYFALRLSRKPKWIYLAGGSFSLAALILSHNALSLMFIPLLLGYFVYLGLASGNKKTRLGLYLMLLILGFGLSAFFWFPAFFEGKYTLRDVVTTQDYASRFRPFRDFIYSPWDYGGTADLSVQIGPLHWLAFFSGFFSLYRFYRKKERQWILPAGLMTAFVVFLLLMLKISMPVWRWVPLLQKFQFPWRFLSPLVFITSILGAVFISFWSENKKTWLAGAVLILLVLTGRNYWHSKDNLNLNDSFFAGAYSGTTDTGESSPVWSVRFMLENPESAMGVIEGAAEIQEVSRRVNRHLYRVTAVRDSRLVENTLYFPGWEILVDGQPAPIQFQDPAYRGLMTFNLSEGNHQVEVKFKETRLRLLADLISLASLSGLLIFVIGAKIGARKMKRWQ